MASFNKVFLMGHLTRDPQVKNLPSQMVIAEFGLAVNRKFKTAGGEDREEVAFVDCSAFGKQAETISQYCTKGKPIFVEGRLKYDQWDDKMGNGKRSKLTVVVENFQFMPGAESTRGRGEGASFGTNGDGAGNGNGGHPGREAGGQADMFGGEQRKPWRGRGKQHADGEHPGREHATAGAPAMSPVGGDKHFDETDIPF